jgi:ribosomal protein S18 acetylase RimI-like enzyme
MEFALDRCRAMGGDAGWLGVWERNRIAIGFHERLGFTTFSSHIFMAGAPPQNDLLMHRMI